MPERSDGISVSMQKGLSAKSPAGWVRASAQKVERGLTRSLDVSTPPFPGTSARNVVEQVPSSRWRGTAPCTTPRTDPFPPIHSGTHLPLSENYLARIITHNPRNSLRVCGRLASRLQKVGLLKSNLPRQQLALAILEHQSVVGRKK